MAPTNGQSQQSTAVERRLLALVTGGTICMQDSPDGLIPTRDFAKNLLVPSSDFHDGSEVESISAIDEVGSSKATVTITPPRRNDDTPRYSCSFLEFDELIDSSSMDGIHWNKIVTALTKNWNSFDAFVVLHGTDTMAYTASMLSFMLGEINKTVIITGSQLSMYYPHNDAHDNLLDSLALAATYSIPEVSAVFHHHLYRGTRVTKVSAFSMAAFTTPNARPLAVVHKRPNKSWKASLHLESIKVASEVDSTRSERQNGDMPPPHSASVLDTTRVAVLKVYPGVSSDLIGHIVQIPDLGGLVLETFGAGNVPLGSGSTSLLQILSTAVKSGIVVVSVTQCLTGSVTSAYESARKMERMGIVTGLDMTTEAAYTKLVYLLSLPDLTRSDIAEKMRQNLRGELTADFRDEQRAQDSVVNQSSTDGVEAGP